MENGVVKMPVASQNGKCITFESDDSTTLLCRVENLPPPGKLNLKKSLAGTIEKLLHK